MPPALADLTISACADAIVEWLDRDLNARAGRRRIRFVRNFAWIELRDFSPARPDGQNQTLRAIWSRLSNEEVEHSEAAILSPEPFVIELHTRDPTRTSGYADPEVSQASRPLPWRRLLLFPTESGVVASGFGVVAPNWYAIRWPFKD